MFEHLRCPSALANNDRFDVAIDKVSFKVNQYKVFFNPLPDDKILDRSKLKQIADYIKKCI